MTKHKLLPNFKHLELIQLYVTHNTIKEFLQSKTFRSVHLSVSYCPTSSWVVNMNAYLVVAWGRVIGVRKRKQGIVLI